MNIKVHDNRSFGRKPVVGIHSMKSMKKFRCEPASMDEPADLPLGQLIGAKPPLLYSFVLLQLMIRGDMSSQDTDDTVKDMGEENVNALKAC